MQRLVVLVTTFLMVVVNGHGYNFNPGVHYGYQRPHQHPHHPRTKYFRDCTQYLTPTGVSLNRQNHGQHQGWSSLTEDTAAPIYPASSYFPTSSNKPISYPNPCDPTYDRNCNPEIVPIPTTTPTEYFSPIYYEEDFNKQADQGHAQGESSSGYLKNKDDAAEVFKNRETTTTLIPTTTTTPTTTSTTTTTTERPTSASTTTTPSPTPSDHDSDVHAQVILPTSGPSTRNDIGGYPSPPIEESDAHASNDEGRQPQEDPNYYPKFEENANSGYDGQGYDSSATLPPQLSSSNEPHPQPELGRSEHELSGADQGQGSQSSSPYNPPDINNVGEGYSSSGSSSYPSGESATFPQKKENDHGSNTFPLSGGWTSLPSKENDYDTKFAKQVLEAHNYYRDLHRAPPLTLDEELSKVAQEIATSFASGAPVAHSRNAVLGDYGESIAIHGGGALTGSDATTSWYKEHVNYDFSDPKLTSPSTAGQDRGSSNTDFTALVWSGSRQLGVGKARGQAGRTFVVATYFPPGNNPSKLRTNVFAPLNLNRRYGGGHGQSPY